MITDGFTYVAALLFMAGVLVTLEKKATGALGRFFRFVPSVVLCYLVAMLLCTLKAWDLGQTKPAYDALKNNLTYAMVFAMLLRCDIRKVLRLGPRMLLGFFSATLTIVVGFVVAFLVMKRFIGSDAWKGLGALRGSWIGGSGNMVAVQAALNIGEADMGYALVIDSIDYSLWVMFLLWAIQLAPRFNRWTHADTTRLDAVSARLEDEARLNTRPPTLQSLLLLCKLLRLDLFTAGVASLANIGGTASAPVLAGAYAGSLVPVGILMALMGYVVGTPLATLCANIMKQLA